MLALCSGPQPCTEAQLMRSLRNETWRLNQLESYRIHLLELVSMWRRCGRRHRGRQDPRGLRPAGGLRPRGRGGQGAMGGDVDEQPSFRAIFKLASAPNPVTSCSAEWGYNTEAHCMPSPHPHALSSHASCINRHHAPSCIALSMCADGCFNLFPSLDASIS